MAKGKEEDIVQTTRTYMAYQCHRSLAIGLYLFPALLPFFVTFIQYKSIEGT